VWEYHAGPLSIPLSAACPQRQRVRQLDNARNRPKPQEIVKTEYRYRFVESGSGIPLVMLHGVVGCSNHWRGLYPYLPSNCRACALDFPFFDLDNPVRSVEDAVRYVEGFIETLHEPKVVLVGNSFGGHVALRYALRHPSRLLGLVLAGSSGLLEKSYGAPPSARPDRAWVRETTCSVFHNQDIVDEEMLDSLVDILGCRQRVRRLVELFRSTRGERLD
jgi:pimeloyl-ACP methyl ester carboxylesterase